VAVDQSLAQASNTLIYSAMLVYTLALGAFAVDLSGRGGTANRDSAPAEPAELVSTGAAVRVGAGATGLLSSPESSPGSSLASSLASSPPITVTRRPAGRSKAGGIAVSLTWLAFLLHAGSVAARGLSVSRAPWGNMYEFALTGSVVVTAVYLAVLTRRDVRYLGTFVIGPVLLTLGLAVSVLYTQAAQLVPALHSFWLLIHVSVAFVASALFTLGFPTTVLQLVQQRREQRQDSQPGRSGNFMDALPGSVDLERSAYRLHVVAFPLWTFTVIAGSIWAEAAWGKYWNWDPKEVWSFVIWVVYAGYLHARVTRGWDRRGAAYLALAGYGCLLFNFLVVNVFFVGMHSYAGV
jgi:cytochrome c-type biogenesis protein CcsB